MATAKKTSSPKTKRTKASDKIEDAVVIDAVAQEVDTSDDKETSDVDVPSAEPETPDTVEETAETGAFDTDETHEATLVHPVPMPVEPPQQRRIFLPLVLGGIVAAVLGFLASELDLFGKADDGITTQLRADLTAQQTRIAALEERAPVVDLGPIDALRAELVGSIADLETRITALENRPVVTAEGVPTIDTSAFEAELEGLQGAIKAQRDEIERLISNARSVEEATEAAAKTTQAQAILMRISGALETGQPFDAQLQELNSLDVVEVPTALSDTASEGVATMATLQDQFPDAARAALAAARANATDEGSQGISGFFKRQLGARSVTPREGSDPDAVLSRAEAAIRNGDLATALAEIDALPAEALAPLETWRAAAQNRENVKSAADEMSQRLTAN